MQSFDIVKKIEPEMTYRVSSVTNAFDLGLEKLEERFTGHINLDGQEWNVGLIVGGSGTGKSTIAKEVFPEEYFEGFEYSAKSVIDDMPEEKSVKEITKTFTSVGFASPPSWLSTLR